MERRRNRVAAADVRGSSSSRSRLRSAAATALLALASGALAAPAVFASADEPALPSCCSSGASKIVRRSNLDLTKFRRTETRANTFLSNGQEDASVSLDSVTGNLLVVWGSRRQEHGTSGVYAQLFDPLGRVLTHEIHVNATVAGQQADPAVAFAPDGTAWVVWTSTGQNGSTGAAVVARRFGPAAGGETFAALGDEIVLTDLTGDLRPSPALAMNDRGEMLVAWIAKSAGGEAIAMGRVLGADGAMRGDEFRLSDAAAAAGGSDRPASVAALADGSFLAAWARFDAAGDPAGIVARRFDARAQAITEEVAVNEADGRTHVEPALAADARGRACVSWMRSRADRGYDVAARVLDAAAGGKSLSPAGATIAVAEDADGWKCGAAVAAASNGRFIVSWNVQGEIDPATATPRATAPSSVFARAFAAADRTLGEAFRVNAMPEGAESAAHEHAIGANNPMSAWSHLDQIAFVWQGAVEGDGNGVGLTLLTPPGFDRPAPPTIDRVAAFDKTPADVFMPPIFDPNVVPQEAEQGVAGVGPDYGFNGIADTGWYPPDPDIAAGLDHVVAVVNGGIAFYEKDGTRTFQTSLNEFWAPVGAQYFVFDPTALWDPHSQRFIACAPELLWDEFGTITDGFICLAVSDDADPNGTWHKYRFSTKHLGLFIDFSNLGVDDEAIYVSSDYFNTPVGNFVHIFPKAPMLDGQPTEMKAVRTEDYQISLGNCKTFDVNAPAQYFATSFGVSAHRIRFEAITDPLGTPTRHSTTIGVPPYGWPPGAEQKGTSNRAATIDWRIKNGVYRNGSFWVAHTIGEEDTARVRWYEFDMNGWPLSGNSPVLVQSGTFDDGPRQYSWFPDICVDGQGNAAIACNRSSPDDYIYIARSVRRFGDPLDFFRSSIRLQESVTPEEGGRWGDYSGIDEDPADPSTFWSLTEYRTNGWRTWVGKVDAMQSIVLESTDLVRGQSATLTASGCKPDGSVYFIYSLTGTGATHIPQLNVTCDLHRPRQLARVRSDAAGVATFTDTVAPGIGPVPVWLQAVEERNESNVVMRDVL